MAPPTSACSQSPWSIEFTAVCSAVSDAEQAVDVASDGPMRLRWYEIRFASMEASMLRMENSFVPYSARQLAVAATWEPTKTPVGLLRRSFRFQPACSQLSHAQPSSIRICGSM
ncbi:MAG: hypothetical protein OXG58_07070 [Gemmatimonadetes bacterium]|nr:hypothetical protein [Gemmatimonadota bacterium]MCY3943927.1 hypothetical protein [Gemmatimonadota bacterium]